jgi:rRNA maturation protein Nop10
MKMKYRISCPECGWRTNDSASLAKCIIEKERAHCTGIIKPFKNAHDAAFGNKCPMCGNNTKEEKIK